MISHPHSPSSTAIALLETSEQSAHRIADLFAETFAADEVAVSLVDNGAGRWRVAMYFRAAPDETMVRRLTAAAAGKAAAKALRFERIAATDWVRESLAGLAPVSAGRFIVHGAHDRARIPLNRIGIEIEASLAFGTGHALPLTGDTGAFWFFSPENVELMVKVLDGRPVNGRFWVFFGALTDVEYDLQVTDTASGEVRTYHNPPFTVASRADTSAFPLGAPAPASAPAAAPASAARADSAPVTGAVEPSPLPCVPDPLALCLTGSRFTVAVEWAVPSGATGPGHALPLSSESGTFWFFDSANLELTVKVLDGRAVNGNFWVFYGALSDVEYTIAVTDVQTGRVRMYHNPQHTLASRADTSAFPDAP